MAPLRIGVLASGGGSNLQAILDACETGRLNGRVVFVGTDNPAAGALDRAARHNVPAFCVPYGERLHRWRARPDLVCLPADADPEALLARERVLGPSADIGRRRHYVTTRAALEALLLERMRPWAMDLLVLAGFMRTLSPYLIDAVSPDPLAPRIMNIHPALLPAFPGTDGYGDTLRYGCKVGGCTVHFIDYGEDTGPIIGQRAFAILPGESLETVRRRGLALEWELYPECIQLFGEHRLAVVAAAPGGRRTVRVLPAERTAPGG